MQPFTKSSVAVLIALYPLFAIADSTAIVCTGEEDYSLNFLPTGKSTTKETKTFYIRGNKIASYKDCLIASESKILCQQDINLPGGTIISMSVDLDRYSGVIEYEERQRVPREEYLSWDPSPSTQQLAAPLTAQYPTIVITKKFRGSCGKATAPKF